MSRTIEQSPGGDTLATLLRLALGRLKPDDCPHDWAALFSLAVRERVVALAWMRSSAVIRSCATESVVAQWRRRAILAGRETEAQLIALAEAVRALRSAGLSPVVLKGAPLSQQLYGDPTVRPSFDCDVYLAREERGTASEILWQLGWLCSHGESPAEETFERCVAGRRHVIEVHSSVLDDPLLSHLRLPVESKFSSILGHVLPVQAGPHVAPCLAGHLAKHAWTPLLWIVDFSTYWAALEENARQAAITAADGVGMSRHLHWAVRLAQAAAAVASNAADAPAAVRLLDAQIRPVGNMHRLARLMRLSAGPMDALRVVAGRLWPPEWRGHWRDLPRKLNRRATGWMYWHIPFEGRAETDRAHTTDEMVVWLDEPAARDRITRQLTVGSVVWVGLRDSTMQPSIPEAAKALITPVISSDVREADVVLVELPHGACALRRVLRTDGNELLVDSDGRTTAERVVPSGSVVGVCRLVDVNGVVWRIEDRPASALGVLREIVRQRIRPVLS